VGERGNKVILRWTKWNVNHISTCLYLFPLRMNNNSIFLIPPPLTYISLARWECNKGNSFYVFFTFLLLPLTNLLDDDEDDDVDDEEMKLLYAAAADDEKETVEGERINIFLFRWLPSVRK
jgi:hypothetical protein